MKYKKIALLAVTLFLLLAPHLNAAWVRSESINQQIDVYNDYIRRGKNFGDVVTFLGNNLDKKYALLFTQDVVTLTANATVPTNAVTIKGTRGGGIDGAYTLTLNGSFIDVPDDQQLFGSDITVTGSISNRVTYAGWWGAVGDGDGAGGGTDNSDPISAAMVFTVTNGGELALTPGIYRCDSTLTMNRTQTSHTADLTFNGGGSVLDFTNLTAGNALSMGAQSQAFFGGYARWVLRDVKLRGGETANPSAGGEPDTSATGLSITYAQGVYLANVQVTRFYRGCNTGFVFPLSTNGNVGFPQNYIGLEMNGASNLQDWSGLNVVECRQSILFYIDGGYGNTKISDVSISRYWMEGSINGVHMDAGENPSGVPWIRRVSFTHGYSINVDYDIFRIGLDWDFDNAKGATRNTSALASIFDVYFNNNDWAAAAATTESAYLVFAPSANCAEVHGTFTGELNGKDMVNTPQHSELTILDYPGDGTRDFYKIRWDGSGNQIPAIDDMTEGTWTPVLSLDNPGDLSVAYTKQEGWYTQTGEEITLYFNIQTSTWTHSTAGTGNIRISGLPANPKSGTNKDYFNAITYSGITKAGYSTIGLGLTNGSGVARLSASGSGVSATEAITSANVPSGGTVILKGQITYQVDF